MKKILSLMLALLMLVSVLVVPVYAGADDGFNDGQFGAWGDPDDDNEFNDDEFDDWGDGNAPEFIDNPYDPLNNWDIVSERTADALEWFNHPEMAGLSVAMRAPTALTGGLESSFTYKNEGHVATAISVAAVVLDGWTFDLAVSGRAAGGEWVALDYVTSATVDIPGASNPAFKRGLATVTVPENIAEVKIALVNTGAAWTFAIDYVDIQWTAATPDTPDVPDEPEGPNGTKDHPYPIGRPVDVPTSLDLKAGESVYYQFPALKFNGWTITGFALTGIEVDGVMNTELSLIDRAIKITLSADGNLVGFYNESEEDVTAILTLEEPLGTSDSPYRLESGVNEVVIPEIHYEFYAEYTTEAAGTYTFEVSDYTSFEVLFDANRYDSENELLPMTEALTMELEGGIPVAYVLRPIAGVFNAVLTVTPPAKGTETNPYYVFGYEDLLAGEDYVSGLWPVSESGMFYNLDGWTFNNTTLKVTGSSPLSVTVNGENWNGEDASGTVTLEIPLELGDKDSFIVKIQGSGSVAMDAIFPAGTVNNPIELNKGANKLHLSETGDMVYATYTADKDGVLIIKPNTVTGLGYTEAFNVTREDYENGYDFIYAGWLDDEGVVQGASEDNVLTIPVSKGDVVNVTTCAGEDEDFIINAMDVDLFVGYEGETPVKIVKESATAAYAKMGAKVSVKVTAEGDGLVYTWYIKNDGGSKYSKSSVTSATYSTTMSAKVKGRRVYCVVTDQYGNSVQSKTFMLREAASITKEPATAAYAKNGAKVSVKITASGDGLKYTWYVKDAGKTKYTKSSITKSTYSAKMSSKVNGRRIYCVVTDKYGKKVQSKTFILKKK